MINTESTQKKVCSRYQHGQPCNEKKLLYEPSFDLNVLQFCLERLRTWSSLRSRREAPEARGNVVRCWAGNGAEGANDVKRRGNRNNQLRERLKYSKVEFEGDRAFADSRAVPDIARAEQRQFDII